MERLSMLLVVLGLCGCALQAAQPLDPWRERLVRCGSAIEPCGLKSW